ncbi:MAG: alanine/glycine:cation symporter family protein [Planctomycetota bacterium]|nr:alanine/glycine:cation symporter family protein [Planctomycetota bacterium]
MHCLFRSQCLLTAIVVGMLTFNDSLANAQEPEGETPIGSMTAESPDASAAQTETAPDPPVETAPAGTFEKFEASLDHLAGYVASGLGVVLFFDILFGTGPSFESIDGSVSQVKLPFVVAWLIAGAVLFTIRSRLICFRGFRHAIRVTAGHYDNPDDAGEVSHFQALTAALSATVGLGNIAGVAIAVGLGGPGATFWMIVAGVLGMSSKLMECTLGQKFRHVRPDGTIMGGAMYYLSQGLKEKGLGPLGKVLAVMFVILCIGGSFGGGCAFQVNQSMTAIRESVPFLRGNEWIYGAVMTLLVGIEIIGGIQRIAATAEKIVPLMCCVYVLACLWILIMKASEVPAAFALILSSAFSPESMYGGFIGVLVTGFKRAAFSNEAGVVSAAIAHAAAKTEYPVREGIVALLEPFIDTVVICTMTALVIIVTGAYNNPVYQIHVLSDEGAALTSKAMSEVISWFPIVLSVAVFLFAYSTMISWSYYGERCWTWLFGDRASMSYRILFLVAVFMGSLVSSTHVKDLSDLMILGMAFPNILGVAILSGVVSQDLKDYWQKYENGEFVEYNKPK